MMAALLALPAMAQDTPGYIAVPGTDTKIHVYGFVTAIGQYDLNQAVGFGGGVTGGFNASGATGQFYASAQGSRVGFATITSSASLGDIVTNIQFDFNKGSSKPDWGTDGTAFHYRYAYIGVGNWTVGMQDSLFSDPNAGLNAIDWNGFPNTNWDYGRLVAARYTAKLNDTNTLGVALEMSTKAANQGANAAVAGYTLTGTPAAVAATTANYKFPSIVAAWTMSDSWGHVRLSAAEQYYGARTAPNVTAAGAAEKTYSTWQGVIAAGFKVNLGKDNVSGTVYTGKGADTYGAGSGYALLDLTKDSWSFAKETGYTLSYTHGWTDVFSSSIGVCGLSFTDDPFIVTAAQGVSSTDVKSYMGAYVNLQAALTKTFSYGVEYKYEKIKAFGTGDVAVNSDGKLDGNTTNGSMITANITATF
jgi:hypothetical protein